MLNFNYYTIIYHLIFILNPKKQYNIIMFLVFYYPVLTDWKESKEATSAADWNLRALNREARRANEATG